MKKIYHIYSSQEINFAALVLYVSIFQFLIIICISLFQNKFLKKSNEELRSQVHDLMEANSKLRAKLGLTPPQSPSQSYTCLTVPAKVKTEIITPSVCDHDHIVIKKEELSSEHASLSLYSLLWDLLSIILVLLIRICEKSPR